MGAVNTTYTFTATDTITSTKMNNIIDQTTMTGDAILGTTLEVADGKLKIRSQGITSNELAANAVKTIAIEDNAVTTAKIPDSNVTTAKILDSNVTTAKILDSNVTAGKLSGAQTGTAPIFGVRAWVVFDMTKNAAGSTNSDNTTRYIPAGGSGNVSSVTKTGTGAFTVNFATELPSVNYAYAGSGEDLDSVGDIMIGRPNNGVKTTSSIALKCVDGNNAAQNFPQVSLIFIG
jgi:hypothetical protein